MNGRRGAVAPRLSSIFLFGALALAAAPVTSSPELVERAGGEEPAPGLDLSTKKDALRAVDQGIQWLKARQNADGSWPSSPRLDATVFATRAILRDPAREPGKLDSSAGKGLEFIASCAQKDGSLRRGSGSDGASSSYTTAISLLPLADSDPPRYEPLILAARRFLVRAQDRREASDQFGGWADLRTTALAIEALAATERIAAADAEKNRSAPAEPDWSAAVAFLSRCQNPAPGGGEGRAAERGPVEGSGRAAGSRSRDYGGFSNDPAPGPASGAATALGLTALIECNLPRTDPRVLAAVRWLRSNSALDGEPGAPHRAGLYAYYYALASALDLYTEEAPARPAATPVDWRRALTIKLISLQRSDAEGLGYWADDPGDRAEKEPILATAYCVLALEILADETAY